MKMTEKPDEENETSFLKARLSEKDRIEKFLRAENKELWNAINTSNVSFLFKAFLFANKIRKYIKVNFAQSVRIFPHRNSLTESSKSGDSEVVKSSFYDIIFVIPTNKIELGGLQSSFELANYISGKGLSVKIVYLNHDPTGVKSEIMVNRFDAKNYTCNLVVVCGSEASDYLSSIENFKFSKSVIFMQGPDHYFETDWSRSLKFIKMLEKSALTLAISPYMANLSKFYGANNVVTVPIGLDLTNFYYGDTSRQKTIVIPCRTNRDKGTQLVIPLIPKLKKLGWRVIGFGDLPDIKMATYFDDFLGRISKVELGRIFRESTILLDPSFIEGLGLIPLEAAACGCIPIVGTRKSYAGLFNDDERPYFEVSNFLDPEEVMQKIEEVNRTNYSKLFSEYILRVDWAVGYQKAFDEIKSILGKSDHNDK
jgi:glycosyltransferase involved in cell wall biosynthesis